MFPPSQTASGVRQKDIAEKVGLSKVRVSEIVSGSKSTETGHVPAVNSVSATDDPPNLANQTGSGGHNARGLHEFLGVGEIT